MAAIVRLYTYSEIISAPVAPSSGRYSSDSVGLLKGRYLGRAQIEADTGSAQSSSADLSSNTSVKLLQYMVEPGKIVHYELFPPGHSGAVTEATTASPYISGTGLLYFGPEWVISVLEASF